MNQDEINFVLRFYYDRRDTRASEALNLLEEAGIVKEGRYPGIRLEIDGGCSLESNAFRICWGPTGIENYGYNLFAVNRAIKAFKRYTEDKEEGLVKKLEH